MKGHVIAPESRKVRNIPGSAQRSLRGTSVLYTNDSCSVEQELPLAATGLLDMFTIVLTGKNKPTAPQLKQLLEARKHMVQGLTRVATSCHWFVGYYHHLAGCEEQANFVTTETVSRGPQAYGARHHQAYAGKKQEV